MSELNQTVLMALKVETPITIIMIRSDPGLVVSLESGDIFH